METKDIEIVQETWQKMSSEVEEISEKFYANLFLIAPEAKSLFREDIKSQALKLKSALNTTVRSLGRMDEIRPILRGLGQRHVGYGAMEAHYDVVGQALIYTFRQILADDWTIEVEKAWINAYTAISSEMKLAAAEVETKDSVTSKSYVNESSSSDSTVPSKRITNNQASESQPKNKNIWRRLFDWILFQT